MEKRFKMMLRGAGSIIDIFPESNSQKFVPKGTATERMRIHWERTGDQLRSAMNEYEQNDKKVQKN